MGDLRRLRVPHRRLHRSAVSNMDGPSESDTKTECRPRPARRGTKVARGPEDPYRLLFESNPMPMWVYDLQTLRFIDVNDAAVRTYGFSRDEFLAMSIADIRPEEDLPRLLEDVRDAERAPHMISIWRHRKKDGTLIDVEVSAHDLPIARGRYRLVLAHDVTERIREERYRSLEFAVTKVLAQVTTLDQALPKLLESICASMGWELGEAWLPTDHPERLAWSGAWHGSDTTLARFSEHSRGVTFARGEGLAGQVWARGRPEWTPDIRQNAFTRRALATEAGLRSALAFPILVRGGPAGVLAFFSRVPTEPDEHVLDLVADLGARIGMFLDRERAQEREHRFAERFRTVFASSPVPIVLGRISDGRIYDVNEAFLRFFGCTREEVVGRVLTDAGIIDPTERERVRGTLGEHRSLDNVEVLCRTKGGEPRHVLLSAQVIQVDHEPSVLATIVDITGRKSAEARKGAVLEAALDGIITMDHEGRILEFNPAAVAIFGYTLEEARGRFLADLIIPPPLREPHRRGLRRYLETGEAPVLGKRIEMPALRKDGTEFPVELAITRIDLPGPPTFTGHIRDISERKRALEEIARSERKFRTLFEAAADPIAVIDRRGTLEDVNPAVEALLGRPRSELVGVTLDRILPPDELSKAREYLKDLIRGRPVPEPFEIVVDTPRGRRILEVRSRVLRELGAAPSVQIVARDVTEQREMNRRLMESERLASMGQVAAYVAHEINTPLTNIALLSASGNRLAEDEKVREKFRKIDDQRRIAGEIIKDLLTLTRAKELNRVETDVREVIGVALDLVAAYRREGVEIVRETGDAPVRAAVDPLRLQQAVANVLKNALQATTEGHVRVRLESGPRDVSIIVRDTGMGMTAEVLERIFQAFFTTKVPGEGTGLGLAFTRSVVEAHGGSIDVASRLGEGTTVTIRIPADGGPSRA